MNGMFADMSGRSSDRVSSQNNELLRKSHNSGVSSNSWSKDQPGIRFATVRINGPHHRVRRNLSDPK